MVNDIMGKDDWNSEIVAEFDGKAGTKADGKIDEDEFVAAASEASGGAVSEGEAKKWFAEMTGFDGEGDNPKTVTTARLESKGMKGHFAEQLDDMNRKTIHGASFNNPEVFDKIDVEPKNGQISLVELKTYVKKEMPNGSKIPDAALDEWFKQVSGGDGNISKDDFNAPDLQIIPADIQGRIEVDGDGKPVLDADGNYKGLDGKTLTNSEGQPLRPPSKAEQLQRYANAEAEAGDDPMEALMKAIEKLTESMEMGGLEAVGLTVSV